MTPGAVAPPPVAWRPDGQKTSAVPDAFAGAVPVTVAIVVFPRYRFLTCCLVKNFAASPTPGASTRDPTTTPTAMSVAPRQPNRRGRVERSIQSPPFPLQQPPLADGTSRARLGARTRRVNTAKAIPPQPSPGPVPL